MNYDPEVHYHKTDYIEIDLEDLDEIRESNLSLEEKLEALEGLAELRQDE